MNQSVLKRGLTAVSTKQLNHISKVSRGVTFRNFAGGSLTSHVQVAKLKSNASMQGGQQDEDKDKTEYSQELDEL